MAKLEPKDVTLEKCITVAKFAEIVRERTKNEKISPTTIHYHLKEKDSLDYVEFCGMNLIVLNEKSENFNPGTYYGHTNTRTVVKQSL